MSGVPQYDRAALFPEVVARLSAGEPLAQICRDEHMPNRRTIYLWLEADEGAKAEFEVARDDGFDVIAADCLSIADDGSRDYAVQDDGEGGQRIAIDHDHIQRSKLRIETRLKLLSKWDPRRYGDKIHNEHTGPGGGPVQHVTTFKLAPLE